MKYLVSASSNVGNVKMVNQDSALIMVGESGDRRILLASVCDGMGGLSNGEVASKTMIDRTREWFRSDFPPILFRKESLDFLAIQNSLNLLVSSVNRELALMSTDGSDMCGTTCVLFLTDGSEFMVMNVGDSRAYRFNNRCEQLTNDQTYVQREIDAGRMTVQEASHHAKRNMLLQCIGASDVVVPEYTIGEVSPCDGYMLCSDGFRHKISSSEFLSMLNFSEMDNEEKMKAIGDECIRLNMQRKERDNITVVLIRPVREEG